MTRKILIATFALVLIFLPTQMLAAAMEDAQFGNWILAEAGNTSSLKQQLKDLQAKLAQVRQDIRQQNADYNTLREGLHYEKATLARERTALDETMQRNTMIERDMLGRLSLVGPPKHLKRWRLQTKLNNALKLLSADKTSPYSDLTRREKLLAAEEAQLEKTYLAKRQSMQTEESALKEQSTTVEKRITYARANDLAAPLIPLPPSVRDDFLESRRLQAQLLRASNAARVIQAVKAGEENHYLTKVQPEVQNSLLMKQQEETLLKVRLLQNMILESLGSNLAPESLQRAELLKLMSGE
ncbi:hypothetical protein COU76_01125 [Candidatus Peregrinibacteria bacterium CG10_big_fil_rev_8_21_14_0_10_49_10]|nr:MAG: hypothetical protein COU76_01125 [Candidatus Peregrinibacteria bacterium CG10_big_fil_rev_8_21_14_0_10_49_10]